MGIIQYKECKIWKYSYICRWTPTDSFLILLFPLNALNKQEKAQAWESCWWLWVWFLSLGTTTTTHIPPPPHSISLVSFDPFFSSFRWPPHHPTQLPHVQWRGKGKRGCWSRPIEFVSPVVVPWPIACSPSVFFFPFIFLRFERFSTWPTRLLGVRRPIPQIPIERE